MDEYKWRIDDGVVKNLVSDLYSISKIKRSPEAIRRYLEKKRKAAIGKPADIPKFKAYSLEDFLEHHDSTIKGILDLKKENEALKEEVQKLRKLSADWEKTNRLVNS